MALSYAVRQTIKAEPNRIWQVLTDADGYARWNPSVVSLEGSIAAGKQIKLVSTVNPKRTFVLTVSDFAPEKRMVWSGGMPLGLFLGTRTLTLRPTGTAETEFAMEEVYTGALAALITRSIPDLSESFAEFAAGLKAESESVTN